MKKKKLLVFTIIIIIILCIGFTKKNLGDNNDLFYFIKTGEDILKHGINFKDYHSFIDLPYTYPHWLLSVYIYLIYSKAGFLGIYINTIASYILLILSIYYVCIKRTKNEFLSSIVSIFCIFPIAPFICARGHVYSMNLMIFEIYFINKLIETGKKKYSIYLILISLLIANIHGTSWIMTLILFLPFIAEHIIYLIMKNKKNNENTFFSVERIRNIKLLMITFIIFALMGLLTPSRICYTYVFKVMQGNSLNYINEHAKTIPIKHPFFIIYFILLFATKKKIKLRDFFMIMGLTIMALMSTRHLFFIYTIGMIYIAKISNEYLKETNDNTLNILEKKIINNNILLIMLIGFLIIPGIYNFKVNLKDKYISEKTYPTQAVKYIKENLDYKNIRMYNNYNIGSYLMFNDLKVIIDSRCDLYLNEFNKTNLNIFDDMTKIYINYEEKFKKYNMNYALVEKKEKLNYFLEKDNNFEKIYSDKYYIIYKQKAENSK